MLIYSALSLDEFYLDEIKLQNGQTAREFMMAYGGFGHIKTVKNLNKAVTSLGLDAIGNEEFAKARKQRLVDANTVASSLREEELSGDSEWEVMSKAKCLVESTPTAYDKEAVLEKIRGLYPSIRNGKNDEVFSVLDSVTEIVKSGGI